LTIMQLIKKKIQSRRGASLTYALLLFLVCAVVGSVVLTAGTAASGRLSQIAEMDQRYYSVNSAARLLVDMLENTEIRVETKDSTETAEDGTLTSKTEYVYLINGKTEAEAEEESKFALRLAKHLNEEKTKLEDTLKISATEAGSATSKYKALEVNIEEEVTAQGDATFTVVSNEGYQIKLRFMNTLGAAGYQWKLYDIESVMPSSTPETGGGTTP